MNKKSDNSLVEMVRSQTNIVDLISDYILLTQKGRYFLGLCPFHQEKTPSFTVTPEKQIFHCFGCGAGGDVFSFVMKKEGIGFAEALTKLASRANIPMDYTKANPGVKDEKSELKSKIYQLNQNAARFFYICLTRTEDGKKALNYLFKRGVEKQTIKKFGLGFAPNDWNALGNYLASQGYDKQLVEQAGLAIARKNGNGYFDRFRNRLIYPIIDVQGRVCGFGGRTLQNEQPKYLNSPETVVFSKSKNLYGLNYAKDEIKKQGTIVLVEGYMDVLAAHQAGCQIAVASLGTALTTEHCRMLASLASKVILVYDGDSAGGRAALKGIEALKDYNITIKVCALPQDLDPDDYIREYGKEKFLKLIENAVPFYDFQIENTLKINNINIQEEKLKAITLIIPILLSISNINQRDEYIKKVAQRFKLPEESLRLQLKQMDAANHSLPAKGVNFTNKRYTNKKRPSQDVLDAPYQIMTAPIKAQQGIIKLIANNSLYLDYIQSELKPEHFTHSIYQEIFNQYLFLRQQDEEIGPDQILNRLSEDAKQVYARLLTEGEDNLELDEKALYDYVECLQLHKLQTQIEKVQQAIEECEREGREDELLRLLVDLQNLKRNSNISLNR